MASGAGAVSSTISRNRAMCSLMAAEIYRGPPRISLEVVSEKSQRHLRETPSGARWRFRTGRGGKRTGMAPRPIWSGTISFGLVTVPVRLFSAVHEHKLEFHLVHEKDDSRIGYEKICKKEGKPVPDDEIVKAFELSPRKLVHLTDEDFEAVQIEGRHAIDLEDFVPYDEIDPTFFAHTYLVGPQEGTEKTY